MFSFSWFRKNKEKETLENELLKVKLEKAMLDLQQKKTVFEKPYMNLKFVNNILTIILKDGDILSKTEATVQDFVDAQNATSVEDLLDIVSVPELKEEQEKVKKDIERIEKLVSNFSSLTDLTNDFIVKDNVVYLKGIERSIPPLLVEKFVEILSYYKDDPFDAVQDDEEYIAHKRFFMWCCLNPRAEVVDKLYNFLARNGMKITKQGFFVGLRNVVKMSDTDNDLVSAISNAYNKVKAVWKKTPSSFTLYKNTDTMEYALTNNVATPHFQSRNHVVIGNLEHLYLNLPKEEGNRYTDNYTKTFDIRIGKVVSMKPEDCSWSTADCAERGLMCSPLMW